MAWNEVYNFNKIKTVQPGQIAFGTENNVIISSDKLQIDSSKGIVKMGTIIDHTQTPYVVYENNLTAGPNNPILNTVKAQCVNDPNSSSYYYNSGGAYTNDITIPAAKLILTSQTPVSDTGLSFVFRPLSSTTYRDNFYGTNFTITTGVTSGWSIRYLFNGIYGAGPSSTYTRISIYDSSGITHLDASSNNFSSLVPVNIDISNTTITIYDGLAGVTVQGFINDFKGAFTFSCFTPGEGVSRLNLSQVKLLTHFLLPNGTANLIGGNIIPAEAALYDIGSSDLPLKQVFSQNLNLSLLPNQNSSAFLNVDLSSGTVGYNAVGRSTQVIFNKSGALTGSDQFTVNDNFIRIGPIIDSSTNIVVAYQNSLKTPNTLDSSYNNITLNIDSSENIVDNSGGLICYSFSKTAFIFNTANKISLPNQISLNLVWGPVQNASSFVYFDFYDSNNNKIRLELATSNQFASNVVTCKLYDTSGAVKLSTTFYNSDFNPPTPFAFRRLNTGLSIYIFNRLIFSYPVYNLTTKFGYTCDLRGGGYGGTILSDLQISNYSGFPPDAFLNLSSWVVPGVDNGVQLGAQSFNFSAVYANVINPGGATLQINGGVNITGSLQAANFPTQSDQRIKTNIESLNTADALAIIERINPVHFTYNTEQGTESQIPGFISQQMHDILPNAVHKGVGYIPNIDKDVSVVKIATDHDGLNTYHVDLSSVAADLQLPTYISIRFDNTVRHLRIDNLVFQVASRAEFDTIYIYGTQVTDFNYLSYDHIYTLNVSATQELAKQIALLNSRLMALENKV